MGARGFKYGKQVNTSRSQNGEETEFFPLCCTEQRIRKFHSIFIFSLSESKVLSLIKRIGGIVCAESNLGAQKLLLTCGRIYLF